MRLNGAALVMAALFLVLPAFAGESAIIIENDPGGLIAPRLEYVVRLRASGRLVAIDGLCASACTLYLNAGRVCVTKRASLVFHQAWDTRTGEILPSLTNAMWDTYPPAIQAWLRKRDFYGMHVLKGQELWAMVPSCG